MFSFSSCSETELGVGLAFTVDLESFPLAGVFSAFAEDDALRWTTCVRVGEITDALTDDARDTPVRAVGVGVPLMDGRDLRDGGPIEPLIVEGVRVTLPPLLARELFARASLAVMTIEGVSFEFFLSFRIVLDDWPASVPDSDMAEGGRDRGVTVKMPESLRWLTLDG